ncbi:unnamed protein product [Polarella glacialis]|uniref:Endo-polygalacturonase n=1 Tax=Polarella glacialis TaxID=89957 RepID=A0A813HXZ6_POLGL|nr:unnamed protein product [Polarella glacialis]
MMLAVAVLALLFVSPSCCLDVSPEVYGAVAGENGREASTRAFREALADISTAGGGTLRVPSGTWYLGPLNLTSHLVLWLSSGATLVADTDMQRLPVLPALASYGPADGPKSETALGLGLLRPQADLRDAISRYQSLFWGFEVENVTITGENGTIDGQGVDWWGRWLHEPLLGRPHLIQFERSKGISIRNVTLRNAGFWTVHFWNCEYVTVQFLTVLVVPWDPLVRPTNTDGVNPDSSSHVLIEDSYFQTGDDAVAVKSGWDCFGRKLGIPSRNITIRRVTVRQTRGCNAAAFTVGSEMSGGVEDVLIEDCTVISAGVGVEIKVGAGRGGFVRRVAVRRLQVGDTLRGALVVMASYPEQNPFCREQNPPAPTVSDISFEDVEVTGRSEGPLVNFKGTPEVFMQNITMRNFRGPSFGEWSCERVIGSAENCQPRACRALRVQQQPQNQRQPPPGTRQSRRWHNAAGAWAAVRTAEALDQEQQRGWRNDGRCGALHPAKEGLLGRCPTAAEFETEAESPERLEAEAWLDRAPCCSLGGWCGGEEMHCKCADCIDYRTWVAPAARADEEPAVAAAAAPPPPRGVEAAAPRLPWAGQKAASGSHSPAVATPASKRQQRYQRQQRQDQQQDQHQGQQQNQQNQDQEQNKQQQQQQRQQQQPRREQQQQQQQKQQQQRQQQRELRRQQREQQRLRRQQPEQQRLRRKQRHEHREAAEALLLPDTQRASFGGLLRSGVVSLMAFVVIFLLRRYVKCAQKWCRTPHVCFGSLLIVTAFQCISFALLSTRQLYVDKPAQEAQSEGADVVRGDDDGAFAEAADLPVRDAAVQALGNELTSASAAAAEIFQPGTEFSSSDDGEHPMASITGSSAASTSSCWRGPSVSPMDFGAVGDGVAYDTAAVESALLYGSLCGSNVVIGPRKKRFLVSPSALELQLQDVSISFEGWLVGPTLRGWNPGLLGWPKGSCAYGEAGCSHSGGPSA